VSTVMWLGLVIWPGYSGLYSAGGRRCMRRTRVSTFTVGWRIPGVHVGALRRAGAIGGGVERAGLLRDEWCVLVGVVVVVDVAVGVIVGFIEPADTTATASIRWQAGWQGDRGAWGCAVRSRERGAAPLRQRQRAWR